MNLPLATGFGLLLCLSTAAVAQQSIVGTYNGNIEVTPNRPQRWGVTMVISSVEGGNIKGTGSIQQGPCRGEYPIEGSVRSDSIGVVSKTKGGASGDCTFAFKGKIDGDRMAGN